MKRTELGRLPKLGWGVTFGLLALALSLSAASPAVRSGDR